jgi:hypothetical protein
MNSVSPQPEWRPTPNDAFWSGDSDLKAREGTSDGYFIVERVEPLIEN